MADPARAECAVCDEPVHWRGLCHKHGERWRRWGQPPLEEWAAACRENRLCTCSECGKQWNGHHGTRHCSPECLAKYKARKALERWNALPAEAKMAASKRANARDKAKRQAALTPRACCFCQEAFTPFRCDQSHCGAPECREQARIECGRSYRTRRLTSRLTIVARAVEEKEKPPDE